MCHLLMVENFENKKLWTYLYTHHILIEKPLHARPCSEHWAHMVSKSRHCPCLHGTGTPMGEERPLSPRRRTLVLSGPGLWHFLKFLQLVYRCLLVLVLAEIPAGYMNYFYM